MFLLKSRWKTSWIALVFGAVALQKCCRYSAALLGSCQSSTFLYRHRYVSAKVGDLETPELQCRNTLPWLRARASSLTADAKSKLY